MFGILLRFAAPPGARCACARPAIILINSLVSRWHRQTEKVCRTHELSASCGRLSNQSWRNWAVRQLANRRLAQLGIRFVFSNREQLVRRFPVLTLSETVDDFFLDRIGVGAVVDFNQRRNAIIISRRNAPD